MCNELLHKQVKKTDNTKEIANTFVFCEYVQTIADKIWRNVLNILNGNMEILKSYEFNSEVVLRILRSILSYKWNKQIQ